MLDLTFLYKKLLLDWSISHKYQKSRLHTKVCRKIPKSKISTH